jgi:Family of unknown function (DUF6220)
MKQAYRVLAYLTALAVAFQTATIAYGLFALGAWVSDGNSLDKAQLEGGHFGGGGSFDLHGTGAIVIAVLGLALLVVSFFAHVPGGVKWAAITFGLIVLQWVLAIGAFDAAIIGILHGVNALAIFAVAVMAGMRVGRAVRSRDTTTTATPEVPTPVG